MPTVEFLTDGPKVVLSGFVIETAPMVAELQAVLGLPSRIEAGERPAPFGHRNNQIHVYDELGLTFNDHHFTRRAQELCCWFGTDEPRFRFTPRQPFTNRLILGGVVMPQGGDERAFFATAPLKFVEFHGGLWSIRLSGFSIFIQSRGPRLTSGRRSRVRQVIEVRLSWPHNNWGAPEGAEPCTEAERGNR